MTSSPRGFALRRYIQGPLSPGTKSIVSPAATPQTSPMDRANQQLQAQLPAGVQQLMTRTGGSSREQAQRLQRLAEQSGLNVSYFPAASGNLNTQGNFDAYYEQLLRQIPSLQEQYRRSRGPLYLR